MQRPPRRKAVSTNTHTNLSGAQGPPSASLLNTTIQGSILLQELVRREIIARFDKDVITRLGIFPHTTSSASTETEALFFKRIKRFKTTTQYNDIVKIAKEVSKESILEEMAMHRLMMITFSEASFQLADKVVAVFLFNSEVCIQLLSNTDVEGMTDNVELFQAYFSICMNFFNNFIADKVCQAGEWLAVLENRDISNGGKMEKKGQSNDTGSDSVTIWILGGGLLIGALIASVIWFKLKNNS